MKKIFKSSLLLIALVNITSINAQTYKLVWEDHFNGTTLDSSKWNVEQKVGIWNTGGNAEFQHYKKENVTVGDDGNGNNCLILTAKKQNYNGYSFTSGKVTTKGKFAFKKGKLEAFIKIPDLANGLWPAFWTLGYTPTGWPDCGEIDVLEMGHARGIIDGVQNSFIGAHLFWGPFPSDYGKEMIATEDLSLGYFKHTMVWDDENISVYFNDASAPYFSMNIADASTEEFRNFQDYIILNMAVGGSVPGIFKENDITAIFPANMYIDWVKVYQVEGKEDFSNNLKIYGDFGLFEDNAPVDMRMDLGFDLFESTSGLNRKTDEPAYEGDNVLAYDVNAGTDFELKLAAGLVRNMINYSQGSLQFAIKTNIADDIQIGLADTLGSEQFISFNTSNVHNFSRDGNWQMATLNIADFTSEIDLSILHDMLIIKGNSSVAAFICLDQMVYKELVPTNNFYGIYTDNSEITDGFQVDNVTRHHYTWENSVTYTKVYDPFEGENVLSFKSSGSQSWFGFGFISDNPIDISNFTNGYLNISIITEDLGSFYIGMDGNGTEAIIDFNGTNDPYAFERDGAWNHLSIPVQDLLAKGLDLSAVNHIFKTGGGGAIGNIAYDNIYLSKEKQTVPVSVKNLTTKNITKAHYQHSDQSICLMDLKEPAKIYIYNTAGMLILVEDTKASNQRIGFDAYPAGIYIVKVYSNHSETAIKIVKQ